jgi:hypothetical protein
MGPMPALETAMAADGHSGVLTHWLADKLCRTGRKSRLTVRSGGDEKQPGHRSPVQIWDDPQMHGGADLLPQRHCDNMYAIRWKLHDAVTAAIMLAVLCGNVSYAR